MPDTPIATALPLDRPALEAACLRVLEIARARGASDAEAEASAAAWNRGDGWLPASTIVRPVSRGSSPSFRTQPGQLIGFGATILRTKECDLGYQ